MGAPAARQGDQVLATDTHIVLVPSAGGPVPTPLPHPFDGRLASGLSGDVMIDGRPAATAGSVARNLAPHLPTPPGTGFQLPPSNEGTVQAGSATVVINGRPAARLGDTVLTCSDPVPLPSGTIATGSQTVMVG